MTDFRTTLRRRADPATVVTELANAKGWRWQDRLNDAGAASFVLADDDPDLALIEPSDLVVIEVNDTPAFTMVIRELDRTAVAGGEEAAQLTTVSGLGHVAVLDEALVYGIRPLWCWPIEDDRLFSWPVFDYDDTAWDRPIVLARWDDATYWAEGSVIGNPPAPSDFPDHDGTWMWAPGATWQYAPAGTCYFRGVFNVPDTYNKIGLYVAADDIGHVYFDGQRIGENTWALENWRTYNETIEVTPGLHVIGVEAVNAYDPASAASGDHNPGGVLCSVYGLGAGGALAEVLLRSDDQWVVLAYPDSPPGMTPGEVITHCVTEAQARGGLAGVTLGFDRYVDSDGTPWPLLGEVSTKIGYDLLTFIKELANTYIDFAMRPGELVLDAWVRDGRGTNTGVDLHPATDPTDPDSGNLRALTYKRVL